MTAGARRWIRGTFALVAALALSVVSVRAQSANGSIEGTIKDSSGGLLPGVTVTIHNLDTGEDRVVVTDASGLYRARFVSLGGGRRIEISGEFKNIFNTVQVASVRGQVQLDTAGNPLVPITFASAQTTTFTSIPTSGSDFPPSGGYEQRKFSLGLKFSF